MTPEELLKAENAFIRLYNQGVSIEEIAERLGIELNTIKDWKKKVEDAIRDSNYPKNVNTTIQSKNEDGSYTYNHSLSITLSGLDKLKFDLWRISSADSENLSITNITKKAKDFLAFVEEHFAEFNYKFDDSGELKINYKYRLNEDRADLEEKANEIIRFYVDYYLRLEYVHEKSVLIKDHTQDYFLDYNEILPFSIKAIRIENFRGIHRSLLHYLPIDSPWIFILGSNGYGKSTFLQSLAIGLVGNADEDRNLIVDKQTKIAIEYKKNGENVINNLWSLFFNSVEHLACYGPSRLQIQSKLSKNDEAEKSTTTYGLFNPDGILLNIENKLIEWHLEKNERLEQVKTLFKEIIPQFADIIIQKNEQDDYEVLYIEQAENDKTNTFEPVPFNQLAAGFRSIVGLIGDLLIRFIRKQPTVKHLSDLAGIVLIDELENHLHPKWQYQLPTLLSKAFPNIQFIATTHSVIPILGAPKNSVFLKVDRSKEKGITVERIDIDVANLLPNTILTSPIFDMDTIRPIANENVSLLRTEETYDEVEANDAIDNQLRELDTDPSQYPALLQE